MDRRPDHANHATKPPLINPAENSTDDACPAKSMYKAVKLAHSIRKDLEQEQ